MIAPTLHVVFAPSAAVDLRRALAETGRTDRVVCPFDDLSFGPINLPDLETRRQWIEEELGYTGWEDVIANTDAFWTESLAAHDRKVAWMSRRTALEYTGFLEWLWRLGNVPCDILDLTDVTVAGRGQDGKPTTPRLATSVALLHWYQILESGLLDRPEPLSSAARQRYVDLWRRLRAENAPLRVLGTEGLASAPISYFDSLLLSFATREWQKTALVVGKSLASFWDNSLLQTGDLVLAARVRALSTAGPLEARGDLFDLRHSEVRLAAGA